MKLIIQKISKTTQSKDGKAYIDKYGKQKTRIAFLDDQHGEKWVSSFVYQNSPALNWQIGDTIEVDVKEENGFLNFYLPKPGDARIEALEKKIDLIARFVGFQMPVENPQVRMYDGDSGQRIPNMIPSNEEGLPQIDVDEDIKPEDLPF